MEKLMWQVQREIFTHEFKKLSSSLKNILDGDEELKYSTIASKIQKGLFDYSGSTLKGFKNMPERADLPNYMSLLELRMYTEAMLEVRAELIRYRQSGAHSYYSYYERAEKVAKEIYERYDRDYATGKAYKYSDREIVRRLLDRSGTDKSAGIVKSFNSALKLGKYEHLLSLSGLKKNEPDLNYEDNAIVYGTFRRNFCKVIAGLSKLGFNDNAILELFQIYDQEFYKTSYLKDKNINLIKYTLSLSENGYLTYQDVNSQIQKIKRFKEILEAHAIDPRDFAKNLQSVGKTDREKFLRNHKVGELPELSSLFTVGCLDNLVKEKGYTHNPLDSKWSLPNSMTTLAQKVKEDIYNKETQVSLEELYPNEMSTTPKSSEVKDNSKNVPSGRNDTGRDGI
jgi:hypothetical protein